MKHILIDFENIQPKPSHFHALDENCSIWLFLGKLQQKTLPVEFCEALCRFGKNVHFLRIAKTGKNALDFYLTYYLGKITEQDKEAEICILSRDGDFDVVIEHITDNQYCHSIVRLEQLSENNRLETENPPLLSASEAKSAPQLLAEDPDENTLLTFTNKVGTWIVFFEKAGKLISCI
ncbi:PIN domain-containing protein [Glaesserella sp.]|uniref:PIN domain-containing protein n=1 Tax=Glaesserella sp. TaxID=2094731 RepID=UPI00359F6C43